MVLKFFQLIWALVAAIAFYFFALFLFMLVIAPLLDRFNTVDATASFLGGSQVRLADLVQGDVVCTFPPGAYVFDSISVEYGEFSANRFYDLRYDASVWVIAGLNTKTRRLKLVSVDQKQIHYMPNDQLCGTEIIVKLDGSQGERTATPEVVPK